MYIGERGGAQHTEKTFLKDIHYTLHITKLKKEEKGMLNKDSDKPDYFTLKEIFPGITYSELQFMNNSLKQYLKSCDQPMMTKVILTGDRFPSNRYPIECRDVARILLTYFRSSNGDKLAIKDAVDLQIDYAGRKWGFGAVYYCGIEPIKVSSEYFDEDENQSFYSES